MTTIRSLSKKLTNLVLDTNIITIGKNLLKWIIAPSILIMLIILAFNANNERQKIRICNAQGISESQCDYYMKYGD